MSLYRLIRKIEEKIDVHRFNDRVKKGRGGWSKPRREELQIVKKMIHEEIEDIESRIDILQDRHHGHRNAICGCLTRIHELRFLLGAKEFDISKTEMYQTFDKEFKKQMKKRKSK